MATLPVSYTTVSEMLVTLPSAASLTSVRSADFAAFAGRAEAVINAKIGRLYTLPLTTAVPLLQTIATDLGLYLLLSRRIFTQERLNNSGWPDRFKEAMELLKEIESGKLPLFDASGELLTTRTDLDEVWSNTMTYHPTMAELHETTQVQDGDKTCDLLDERDLTTDGRLT